MYKKTEKNFENIDFIIFSFILHHKEQNNRTVRKHSACLKNDLFVFRSSYIKSHHSKTLGPKYEGCVHFLEKQSFTCMNDWQLYYTKACM